MKQLSEQSVMHDATGLPNPVSQSYSRSDITLNNGVMEFGGYK